MADEVTASSRATGLLRAEVAMREHRVTVDEPAAAGGTDTGAMPTELLAAALASCLTLAINYVADKRAVVLGPLEVNVRAQRAGGELRYGEFEVEVSAGLPASELQPLLDRAKRFCWVSNTLSNPPAVNYTVRESTTEEI